MNDIAGSIDEGTFFVIWHAPGWPPPHDALIREHQLSDGRLILWVNVHRQIVAELAFEHDSLIHPRFRVVSHEIAAVGAFSAIISVTWEGRRFKQIHLNGSLIFSANPNDVLETPTFSLSSDPAHALEDFTEDNERARDSRKPKVRNPDPNAKRRFGGETYALDSLADEVRQLKDLLGAVQDGNEYHVPGIASRVRLLVNPKSRGLLQLSAGFRDFPLILYTTAHPKSEPVGLPNGIGMWLALNGSPVATALYNNPVDLDIWLEFPALHVNSRSYTNLEVVKEIGDTIGSHRDLGITSAIDGLMRRPSLAGSKYNDVTSFTVMFGAICLDLAEQVLGA